jgi:hypothetical protein
LDFYFKIHLEFELVPTSKHVPFEFSYHLEKFRNFLEINKVFFWIFSTQLV